MAARRRSAVFAYSLACALSLGFAGLPAQARDFRAPDQRERRGTAYSLPRHMGAAEIGLLGVGEDLVGRLGFAYGFGKGFEADINLAHAGVGILTLATKWNFLDREHVGLGFRLGFIWVNGQWVWFLPELERQIVKDIDAIIVPLRFVSSLPITPWLQLDLSAGYQHAEIFGGSGGRFLFDAQLGVRQVTTDGSVRFYVADTVQFFFTAHLPVWTRSPQELTASVQTADGVYVGLRRSAYEKVPFSRVYSLQWGIQSAMSRFSYVTFSFVYNQVDLGIYRSPVHPALNLEFRF